MPVWIFSGCFFPLSRGRLASSKLSSTLCFDCLIVFVLAPWWTAPWCTPSSPYHHQVMASAPSQPLCVGWAVTEDEGLFFFFFWAFQSQRSQKQWQNHNSMCLCVDFCCVDGNILPNPLMWTGEKEKIVKIRICICIHIVQDSRIRNLSQAVKCPYRKSANIYGCC